MHGVSAVKNTKIDFLKKELEQYKAKNSQLTLQISKQMQESSSENQSQMVINDQYN